MHGSGTPFWTKRSIEAVNGEHFALFSFDFRPVLGRNGPFEVRQLGRMNFWFVVKPLPFFGFFVAEAEPFGTCLPHLVWVAIMAVWADFGSKGGNCCCLSPRLDLRVEIGRILRPRSVKM